MVDAGASRAGSAVGPAAAPDRSICRWQRKIASGVGIAEIVLLQRKQGAWVTLAVGDLSLDAIARAEAWLVVPGGAEGFAAGAPVDGYMLRE